MLKKRIALYVGFVVAYVSVNMFIRRAITKAAKPEATEEDELSALIAYANSLRSAHMTAFSATAEGQEPKCLLGDLQVVWLNAEEHAIEDMSHTGIAHCTSCGLQEVINQMSDDCRLDDFIDAHYQL